LVRPLAGSVYVAAVWLVLIAVYVPPELVLRDTVYAVAPLTAVHAMVIAPFELVAVKPALGAAGAEHAVVVEVSAEVAVHTEPTAVTW
jgi:hypothetical protein